MMRLEKKVPPLTDGSGNLIGFFRSDLLQGIDDLFRQVNGLEKSEFSSKSKKIIIGTDGIISAICYYADFMRELQASRKLNLILDAVFKEFLDDVHPKIEKLISIQSDDIKEAMT